MILRLSKTRTPPSLPRSRVTFPKFESSAPLLILLNVIVLFYVQIFFYRQSSSGDADTLAPNPYGICFISVHCVCPGLPHFMLLSSGGTVEQHVACS